MWLNPTLLEALANYLAEIYASDLGFKYGLIPIAFLLFILITNNSVLASPY
jgi:hypothetical protein